MARVLVAVLCVLAVVSHHASVAGALGLHHAVASCADCGSPDIPG